MTVETLRPNAAGDECNISAQTGAACPDHYQNVDEVVADDNATFVRHTADDSWARDLYNLPPSAGSGGINKITVYARFKRYEHGTPSHNAQAKIAIKSGTTTAESGAFNLSNGWVTKSYEWSTDPNTSAAWTWAAIDILQIGINLECADNFPSNDSTAYCTQIYVEIDYTPGTEKSSSDTGTGSEGTPVPTAALAGSEDGQGLEAISSQLAAITAVDNGTSVELGALLKELFASELGWGADSFTAKIELPTRGGGMKLWT